MCVVREIQATKKCKYLGSLLDTTEDMKRRKALTTAAMKTYNPIWRNKAVSLESKLRIFHALVEPIFLYNQERKHQLIPEETIQICTEHQMAQEDLLCKATGHGKMHKLDIQDRYGQTEMVRPSVQAAKKLSCSDSS